MALRGDGWDNKLGGNVEDCLGRLFRSYKGGRALSLEDTLSSASTADRFWETCIMEASMHPCIDYGGWHCIAGWLWIGSLRCIGARILVSFVQGGRWRIITTVRRHDTI
jgi:hypothetical protein